MSESPQLRALTDPELAEVVRTGVMPRDAILQDLAFELVRARQRLRGESRKAEQLRKLRWNVEHLLTKIEEIATQDATQNATQNAAIERETAEAIATWLERSKNEPLVAAAIRDWKWR